MASSINTYRRMISPKIQLEIFSNRFSRASNGHICTWLHTGISNHRISCLMEISTAKLLILDSPT